MVEFQGAGLKTPWGTRPVRVRLPPRLVAVERLLTNRGRVWRMPHDPHHQTFGVHPAHELEELRMAEGHRERRQEKGFRRVFMAKRVAG